jgi:uncharacterized membrane protein YbjE (DUF340 family)
MVTSSKPLISFTKRGLPGLVLLALGLCLGLKLGQHSPWSAEVKSLVYPLALLLAVGGCNLVGSYVHQRSFHSMRKELLASAMVVVSLWLGSLAH